MPEVLRKDQFPIVIGAFEPGLYKIVQAKDSISSILPRMYVSSFSGNQVILQEVDNKNSIYNVILPAIAEKHLSDGDIVRISNKSIRIILCKKASANTLLLTEQCDNLCKFCSQPPKNVNDEYLFVEAASALIEFNYNGVIGLSGGEPFLQPKYISRLFSALAFQNIPTGFHILTNGRAFKDVSLCKSIYDISRNREIVLGIPIYSVNYKTHDQLVGREGAWAETISGLINLSHMGVNIELRYIPTKENIQDLVKVVPFFSRCLPLISQISIMNLEPTGWARKNWDDLYISPLEYKDDLTKVHDQSLLYNQNTRLFNYPLCHINPNEYCLTVRSISDWKNRYMTECGQCTMIGKCGGFFSSAEGKFLDKPRILL